MAVCEMWMIWAKCQIGVQALDAIPRKSNRKGVGDVGVTLNFGGITINNGDFVYADNNGIILSQKSLIH